MSRIDPYVELGITRGSSHSATKSAYRALVTTSDRNKQARVSLSYYMICSSKPEFFARTESGECKITDPSNLFYMALIGDTTKLIEALKQNRHKIQDKDAYDHTLVYVAARAGYCDMVEALLEMDISFMCDDEQDDGSSSLHVACYYGHDKVVSLLMQHGADPTLRNKWGHTPIMEAATPEIKKIIETYEADKMYQILENLKKKKLINRIHVVDYRGKTVAEEGDSSQATHFKNMQNVHDHWLHAWHGSKEKHLASILENGLKKPGSVLKDGTKISIPGGHIPAHSTVNGVKNWGMAIFLTPDIFYATSIYSQKIESQGEKWCIVIKTAVEPSAYKAYKSTTPAFDRALKERGKMEGEPSDYPEYRVEDENKVIVESVVFVSDNFLHSKALGKIPYSELQNILCKEYGVEI